MFDYPPTTLVNRVIPKSKILQNAQPTTRLKNLLAKQVHQIRWQAKLAPETINLSATPQVPEIQIFHLILKGAEIHPDLLQLLDKTIPHPILFSMETADHHLAYSAAYKRPSEGDASQWVVGARFISSFIPQPSSLPPLPTALDLGHLYSALLEPLLPLVARKGEMLPELIERCSSYQALVRIVAKLQSKVQREKQFNRRIAFNQELNEAKAELAALGA
ncbi:MAG: DUF4391 domain-containing protein [Verrucomicrobiales bacterium]|nr:DUF4391 domain-containing protein [Verrucomicrobiales bacterium]